MKQILYVIILLTVVYLYFKYAEQTPTKDKKGNNSEQNDHSDNEDWLPTSSTGAIVKHTYYTLSYNEKHEQAEWVAYQLTRERLTGEHVKRNDNFRPDPEVSTGSATPNDYRGSGYDRGHLCPAADMAFNEDAMSETFFMSNMSPQDRKLNHGVWRELEESTRDWAKKCKQLYVVTGPVLKNTRGYIGKQNHVSIPGAYYRVLVDMSKSEPKGIAYIIPNEVRDEPLDHFAKSIDEVEKTTGLDFFPNLKGNMEQNIEASFDINLWRYDQRRFQQRVDKWNKE
jgi:endonuclease G, mitochondrial